MHGPRAADREAGLVALRRRPTA